MPESINNILWWAIPGCLAGMPMPFIHPERRMKGGGALNDYQDDLPTLYEAGIRAVVSLLNLPSDESIYRAAGFAFLCLPVPDDNAPTFEQAARFVTFVAENQTRHQAVAVHCEAGLGRTGTMLAAYLVSTGMSATEAVQVIRTVEKSAVETKQQILFLENYAESIHPAA